MNTRRLIILATLTALSLSAQTPAPTVPPPAIPSAPTVQLSTLPTNMVGTGISWNRYAAAPISEVTTVAVQISKTNLYSWSTLDTPMSLSKPAAGVATTPSLSSIRTGAAYVFAQSASTGVAAFALGDIGLATSPSANLSQYSGGVGLSWRIGKSHFYAVPLYRVIGTAGTGVQTVPEVMLFYSFGGSN